MNDTSPSELTCRHHPEVEATGQCDHCGDMLCADCLKEYLATPICADCEGRIRRPYDPYIRLGAWVCLLANAGVSTLAVFISSLLISAPTISGMAFYGLCAAAALMLFHVLIVMPATIKFLRTSDDALGRPLFIAVVSMLVGATAAGLVAVIVGVFAMAELLDFFTSIGN